MAKHPDRPMWRVYVDDVSMAHGPDDGSDHPEHMASLYRDINPESVVTVYRWVQTYD